ncbi:MAG TPA: BatA domain-containing protein [Gemmatimonadales bacterium]|nr:BatA domain-containing protein [Gemmatimonadales bacterium]
MTFLHPLALLGLAAAALPAFLHLLQRRTPPELAFPPLRYLTEAERQSARRLRLRHLLLLLLRTALIVAVVLAAARPLVPGAAAAEGVGASAHQPTALVVILDNSPSSGAVVDGRPVLDRLRVAARVSLARSTSADRVWLVLADGVVRGGSREALLASVDNATPTWTRLDLVAAVDRAARLTRAEPLPGHEVHVLSDLQRTALASGRADAPRSGSVRVLALAAPRARPNRGIAAARVAEGAAIVSIAGSDGTEPVPVTVRVRGRDVGRALAAPGAVVSVALPTQAPGWWAGEAVLEPDELRADDQRPFVWRVAPPARVGLAPGSGPFVAAALAVLREGRRVSEGGPAVVIGETPGSGRSVVLPPADPALLGQANRALAARGVPWRWAAGMAGTPGPLVAPQLELIGGVQVTRRYRLEGAGEVLATVNGEPWLVRSGEIVLLGSRLDTAWTALPTSPGFVPLVDALVNRMVAGEADVVEAEGPPRVEFQVRGADTVGATVFGPDPRESDLTPATPEQVAAALGAEVLDDRRFAVARFAGTRRADASGVLLVLALLLAAAELGVATRTR